MKRTIWTIVLSAVKFNFLAKVTIEENLSTLRLENGKHTPLKAFEFLVIAVFESSEFKDFRLARTHIRIPSWTAKIRSLDPDKKQFRHVIFLQMQVQLTYELLNKICNVSFFIFRNGKGQVKKLDTNDKLDSIGIRKWKVLKNKKCY